MKRIYIAGPIRKGSIVENVGQADDAMLAIMAAGHAPFNPMLSCFAGASAAHLKDGTQFIPHPLAHGAFRDMGAEPWLLMDLAWVEVSDAVLRLPGESSGADGEVAHATAKGIPVFHDLDECIRWATT